MKILIIEDEYNLADAIKSILVEERYDVEINTDGEIGLDNALSGIYDLIMLDRMLPELDGISVLKKMAQSQILWDDGFLTYSLRLISKSFKKKYSSSG